MQVRALRLLLWHCGHFVSDAFISKVNFSIIGSKFWQPPIETVAGSVHVLEVVGRAASEDDHTIYAHVYSDGTVIFSIADNPSEIETVDDIDPIGYTRNKRVANRDLLGGSHKASVAIEEFKQLLRDDRQDRIADLDLIYYPEFNDYSYVFTTFFVTANPSEAASGQKLMPLIRELITPSDVTRIVEGPDTAAFDMTGRALLDDCIPSEVESGVHSVRLSPFTQVLCSWASVVVVGNCDQQIYDLVWRLERGIQHIWHIANVMERTLTKAVSDSLPKESFREIARLQQLATRLTLGIERFRGVPRGMSNETEIRFYRVLRSTSRLDEMYEKVERLRRLVQERYQNGLENRRHHLEAVIGFTIYILTIITGWGAFRQLQLDQGIGLKELAVVSLLIFAGGALYFIRETR